MAEHYASTRKVATTLSAMGVRRANRKVRTTRDNVSRTETVTAYAHSAPLGAGSQLTDGDLAMIRETLTGKGLEIWEFKTSQVGSERTVHIVAVLRGEN